MNKKIIVLLALMALMGHLVQSQTLIDNYRVSTGVDTTQWIDITGQDTVLLATHAGTMSSGRSVSNDIGFTFPFADTSFTQFGVNVSGLIRMGGSTSLTPFWQTNPLTRVANMPLIVPFGIQGQLDTTCHVRCATVGAAGSQVLVVEMRMKIYNMFGAYVSSQVQLYEATGEVRIVYGSSVGSNLAPASQPGMAMTATDILFIDHATHSVQRLTSSSVPTNAAGVWPEKGRYYSFVPEASVCPFPPAISTLNNQPDSVVLAWGSMTDGTAWRLTVPAVGIDTLLNDTTFTFGGLEPTTVYSAMLQTLCGADTSLGRRLFSFTTGCGTVHQLPWNENFQTTATANCWLTPYLASGSRWQRQSSGDNYYMRTGYSSGWGSSPSSYNEWLISPPVELPDTAGLTLSWWYKCEKQNSVAPRVRVRLLVCDTTDEADTAAAWVTLEVIDYYEQNFQQHFLSLDAYAGHRVRVAFQRYGGLNGKYAYVDNVSIEVRMQPLVSLEAPARAYAGDTTAVLTHLVAGVLSNPQYEWSSTMDYHGQTLLLQDNDTLRMVYLADGMDTVTVTLTTDYGTATATAVIEVVDCLPVTVYPWSDGFEHGFDCWEMPTSGPNVWDLRTTGAHSGQRVACATTHDVYNPFDTLVSQPIVVPTDAHGLTLLWWMKRDNSLYTNMDYRHILVKALPAANPVWAAADTLFYINGAGFSTSYQQYTVDLEPLAGQTVRLAWTGSSYESGKYIYIDDIEIRYTREPVGSLAVSATRVDEGDTVTATATLAEGDTAGITYLWESFMADYGQATIIGSGSEVGIVYNTPGTDTVILTVTNAYGSFSDTSIVLVCPIQDTLPWVVDFGSDFPCWQVLGGSCSVVSGGYLSFNDWNMAVASPQVYVPDNGNVVLEYDCAYSFFYGSMLVMVTTDMVTFDTLGNIPFVEGSHPRNRIPLTAYGGQHIHVVFKATGETLQLYLYNVQIRYALEPVVTVSADDGYFPGTPMALMATLVEGDTTGITYTWTSAMTERGEAELLSDGGPQATLTCYGSGVDTITVVATNAYASGTAWTTAAILSCDTVVTFPWVEDFGNAFSCWWQPEGSLWSMPEDGSDNAAMTVNVWEAHDSWLVSRPIALPDNVLADEGEGLQLWWDAASEWQSHHDYCVLVTTAADYRDLNAYDTLRAVSRNHSFRSNGWDTMHAGLGAYAGQTIHLALRYTTEYYEPDGLPGVLLIDNVRIIDSRPPEVTVQSPVRCFVGDTAVYRARVTHGVRSGMSYAWQSSMAQGGQATVWSNDSLFHVIRHTEGWDTVSLVATNAYGSDSVSFRQIVLNCPAVSVPWLEDFEVSNPCWIGSWTLDQVTFLANDSTTNVIQSNPNSLYASPLIDLPDTVGLQLMWYKWASGSNLIKIFVSPTGNIADFTELLHRQTSQGPDSVSLDAYAGRRIRVAFAQAASSNYFDSYSLDDIRVDYNRAVPQVSLTAPSEVGVGDRVNITANVAGSPIGLTYNWHSSLSGQSSVVDGQWQLVYDTVGVDTVTCIVANAFGSDTAVAVIQVMDSIDDISPYEGLPPSVQIAGPSTVDVFDTVTFSAQLLAGDTVGLSYSWSSVVGGLSSADSQLSVVYQEPCVDTLMLVATNGYGSDSVVQVVNVQWPAAWLPQAELVVEPYYYSCDTAIATLRWLAGDTTGRTLALLSSMATTVTVSDSTAFVVYASGGTDTLRLIAANDYGADTVSVTVQVRNCGVASAMPYFSFPGGNNNDFDCWKTWSFNTSIRAAHTPTYDPAVWRKGWDDYNSQHKQVSSSVQNAGLYGDTAVRPDSWLLSPMVALPANADTITLRWNTACHSTTYYLLVSTTGRTAPRNYTDTVLVETDPDGDNHTPWSSRSLSLSQYAGQTISLAFHHTGPIAYGHTGRVAIDSIRIECTYLPAPPPPDTVWYTVTVNAVMDVGHYDGLDEMVHGAGTYADGSTVILEGDVHGGSYGLFYWLTAEGDTIYDNPYTFVIHSDVTLTAVFVLSGGIDGVDETAFTIYPNPASTTVNVETDQPSTLTLMDVTGLKVADFEIRNSKFEIDISTLPAGIYFVRLSTSPTVRKLIIK